MKIKFKDLENSHLPNLQPKIFEEWKNAGLSFNKNMPIYSFITFVVLFAFVFAVSKNFLIGGLIPILIARYVGRLIAGKDYFEISNELGISEKDVNALLRGKIDFIETKKNTNADLKQKEEEGKNYTKKDETNCNVITKGPVDQTIKVNIRSMVIFSALLLLAIFLVFKVVVDNSDEDSKKNGNISNVSEFYGKTIGTTYSIKIVDSISDYDKEKLHEEIRAIFNDLILQMSTYEVKSEISQFNSMLENNPMDISNSFLRVLNIAMDISIESEGAFDATVGPAVNLWGFGKNKTFNKPLKNKEINELKSYIGFKNVNIKGNQISKVNVKTELDLSGIAKGYMVDTIANLLRNKGYSSFIVTLGGDLVLNGTNNNDRLWKIGVTRPSLEPAESGYQVILEISNKAVSTSGDYGNYFVFNDSIYSHIIDPRTCRPITNNVASVTVIAPNCTIADAMATAIMVMGEKRGLEWVESKPDIEALIILREDYGLWTITSSGFDNYVVKE